MADPIIIFFLLLFVLGLALYNSSSKQEKKKIDDEEYRRTYFQRSEKLKESILKQDSSLDYLFDDDTPKLNLTFSVPWMDSAEETIDLTLPKKDCKKLKDASDAGEILDTAYISASMPTIHKRIIRFIKNYLDEETYDPDDGYVEIKVTSPPALVIRKRVKVYPSHLDMLLDAQDEDFDYYIEII